MRGAAGNRCPYRNPQPASPGPQSVQASAVPELEIVSAPLLASTANTSNRLGFVSVFEKAEGVHDVAELLHVVLSL